MAVTKTALIKTRATLPDAALTVSVIVPCYNEEASVEATLEVRPSNLSAASLYRRLGFQVVGRRKAYYQDTGEDAILMYKDLGA